MRHIIRATGLLQAGCSLKRPTSCTYSSFLAQYRFSVACYHHSAKLHRYFTNRYHKKVCPSCGRPNILPAIACAHCLHQLTDANIRSVGRDALRDLVLARQVNHDQSKELESRVALLEKRGTSDAFLSLEDLLHGLPQPLTADHLGLGQLRCSVELFRSFDFVVLTYPFPASLVHLSAVPKASMYDIRQLRRSHLPLLKSMKDKLSTLASHLADMAITSRRELVPTPQQKIKPLKASETLQRSTESHDGHGGEATYPSSVPEARQQIRQQVLFGFNYPSEYSQLCLHAIIPPIDNFVIFEPPYFYPLNKVLWDLEHCGTLQIFPPSSVLWSACLPALMYRSATALVNVQAVLWISVVNAVFNVVQDC